MFYRRRVKRVCDVLIAGGALVVLSPALLAIAAVVYLRLGSPVLFRQVRPGLGGGPFTMLKFRTMRVAVDGEGRMLSDSERLHPVGRLLRNGSLDELPELVNVLRGEMSLVGPRPLLPEYLPLYSTEQGRRHEVLPGITGWAQVNGRNRLRWVEKFRFDVWYVDNLSWWLDLKIIGLTVWKIVRREGINEPGQATAAPFQG